MIVWKYGGLAVTRAKGRLDPKSGSKPLCRAYNKKCLALGKGKQNPENGGGNYKSYI